MLLLLVKVLTRWQKTDSSKLLLSQGCGWIAGDLGKLCGNIKSDGDHTWNGFGTIEGLVGYLEFQIGDWQTNFDLKNIQIWKMTKDEEDDDIWGLKDNKYSLEFTFDWSIKIERFP